MALKLVRTIAHNDQSGVDSFHDEILKKDVPALITGLCSTWPAYSKWSLDYFRQHCADALVPLSYYRTRPHESQKQKQRMRLFDYLAQVEKIEKGEISNCDEAYAAGWHYETECPHLCEDIVVPEHFQDNWIERVQKVVRFEWTSLFFGHSEVSTPLHTDSFFVQTWLALVRGKKTMRLVSCEHNAQVHNGLDIFDPAVVEQLSHKGIDVWEMQMSEGDVAYMPPGWWHQVLNEGLTIAVSNNYVDAFHFQVFEQQLRAKFLQPLLALGAIRKEAVQVSSSEGLPAVSFLGSRFIENEKKYLSYFGQELAQQGELVNRYETHFQTVSL